MFVVISLSSEPKYFDFKISQAPGSQQEHMTTSALYHIWVKKQVTAKKKKKISWDVINQQSKTWVIYKRYQKH